MSVLTDFVVPFCKVGCCGRTNDPTYMLSTAFNRAGSKVKLEPLLVHVAAILAEKC